ncbi:hypothetical protein MMC19_004630 [Ptychographa xylographoides]|nr:hypothetical protein [Ptychographa xylographoides]
MASISPLTNLPFQFEAKEGWAGTLGPQIKADCDEILSSFPVANRMRSIEFKVPRIYTQGDCAIGVFVSKRDTSGTTVVTENWRDIVAWGKGANSLNTGGNESGWMVNMLSGVQICFWEPKIVDPFRMCSTARSYENNHWLTIAKCLDILYTPDRSSSRQQDSSSSRQQGSTPPRMPPIPNFSAPPSPQADFAFTRWQAAPLWVGPNFKLVDCLKVIESLESSFRSTVMDGSHMQYPNLYNSGSCTIGLFFTEPPASGEGGAISLSGMSVQAEALHLLTVAVMRHGFGGFADLSNGLQIVVYEQNLVDPRNVCLVVSRISLRTCLDNMVEYNRRNEGPS